ncbi:MAG TPA: hypothetical protein DC049_20615 [Spirochaetia bacterium]|nr:hypothetical protein [Spirochaetia bacterium]
MFKNYIVVLILASLILALSSCSKKKSVQKILKVAWSYNPTSPGNIAFKKAIDSYAQKNPNIKIEYIFVPGNQYWSQMLTMAASGNTPDLFRMGPDFLPQFLKKNIIMPLDDFIVNSPDFNLNDFFAPTLYKYRYDGEKIGSGPLYGLGTDWSPDQTVFFNRDLLDKKGLSMPEKSMTWDEYLMLAKKLTDRNGANKIFGSIQPSLFLLCLQNGGKIFSDDGKRCLMNSKENMEALTFHTELDIIYNVVPSRSEMQDSSIRELFETGKLGIFFSGRHMASELIKSVGSRINWFVAPSIHKTGRPNLNMINGPFGWVIGANTKYPQEAWELLKMLTSGEGEKRLARVGYNIPILKSLAYSDIFLNNPAHPAGMNKIFLDEVEFTVPSPASLHFNNQRFSQIVRDNSELIRQKTITIKQGAENITQQVNAIAE